MGEGEGMGAGIPAAAGILAGAVGAAPLATLMLRGSSGHRVPSVGTGVAWVLFTFGFESAILMVVRLLAQGAVVPFGAGLATGFLGVVCAGVARAEHARGGDGGSKKEG